MARVVCPSPGCQITLMDSTISDWDLRPKFIICEPSRILAHDGYAWREHEQYSFASLYDIPPSTGASDG